MCNWLVILLNPGQVKYHVNIFSIHFSIEGGGGGVGKSNVF